jgi:hypothetical protein
MDTLAMKASHFWFTRCQASLADIGGKTEIDLLELAQTQIASCFDGLKTYDPVFYAYHFSDNRFPLIGDTH